MNGKCTRYARLLSVVMGLCLVSAAADAGTVMFLTADAELIDPSATVGVEMAVTHTGALDDVAGYQGVLDITGGDDGSLDINAVNINHANSDWIFFVPPFGGVIDCTGGIVGEDVICAVTVSNGVEVVNPGYMGDFTLLATSDAEGVFAVDINTEPDRTELFDNNTIMYPFTTAAPEDVGVDIECFANNHCGGSTPFCKIFAPSPVYTCVECLKSADCDDGNSCTTDACDKPGGYVCQHTDLSQGTSCDDGLFCTDVDECDANATCVGTGDPCTQSPFIQCCEATDTCLDPNGFIQCQAGP